MRKDAMASNQDLQRLLDELGRLPGIGPKSAQRIAYHLLEADAEEARRLAQAILDVKGHVQRPTSAPSAWTACAIARASAWLASRVM